MGFSKFFNVLKYILTFFALLNLLLLFGFQYEIPEAIKDKFFKNDKTSETNITSTKAEETSPLKIHFETDTFTYDGSGSLDLLQGVTVTDREGNLLDLNIYSSIKSSGEALKKIVSYTVKDEDGNTCAAERTLMLENYDGPVITIGQALPAIYDTELKYIPDTFEESGIVFGNDGYGTDISDSIECSYKVTNSIATEAVVTFTVTNHFDDTVSKSITVPIQRTKPLILLSKTSVTLEKGEAFDPLSYVESATNEEGQDLTSRLEIANDVNTGNAGSYTVTYTLKDRDREEADPVTLEVIVEEYD